MILMLWYTEVKKMKNISVTGIMCILHNDEKKDYYFHTMKSISADYGFKAISMGMSHGYELAVHCGATIV